MKLSFLLFFAFFAYAIDSSIGVPDNYEDKCTLKPLLQRFDAMETNMKHLVEQVTKQLQQKKLYKDNKEVASKFGEELDAIWYVRNPISDMHFYLKQSCKGLDPKIKKYKSTAKAKGLEAEYDQIIEQFFEIIVERFDPVKETADEIANAMESMRMALQSVNNELINGAESVSFDDWTSGVQALKEPTIKMHAYSYQIMPVRPTEFSLVMKKAVGYVTIIQEGKDLGKDIKKAAKKGVKKVKKGVKKAKKKAIKTAELFAAGTKALAGKFSFLQDMFKGKDKKDGESDESDAEK